MSDNTENNFRELSSDETKEVAGGASKIKDLIRDYLKGPKYELHK